MKTMEISADAWSQIPSWMPARKVISRMRMKGKTMQTNL